MRFNTIFDHLAVAYFLGYPVGLLLITDMILLREWPASCILCV